MPGIGPAPGQGVVPFAPFPVFVGAETGGGVGSGCGTRVGGMSLPARLSR
ncbi:MAG: hypothetical protein RL527_1548 [Planctomycetota bacterium]